LIQKPKHIANCWSSILKFLQSGQDPSFQTVEAIAELYDKKLPTAKKINKLLKADVSNDAERQAIGHLKRYVKTLGRKGLGRFLHFVTGSNVIAYNSIEVIFTTLDGFQRRPIVQTCGPSMELPCTYQSCSEVVEEFTSVMRENISWSFDFM
jgi:hypothetical protein